ncbi:MAG: hypothetical protein FMNOHCHN_01752 [Ignavibacteriaceae bacterium]|nr:hypothetical protein [Ignavibacteriaceae bacterium]
MLHPSLGPNFYSFINSSGLKPGAIETIKAIEENFYISESIVLVKC